MDADSTFAFHYDSVSGDLSEISYPNGIVKRIEMEEARNLVKKISYTREGEQEPFLSHEYSYDARSLPISRTDKRGNVLTTERFEYNSRGELIYVSGDAEQKDSSLPGSFRYDEAGNRLLGLSVNSLNQYGGEDQDGFSPEYDADGNQTLVRSATGIWRIEWNADGKPVSFTQEDIKIACVYDSKGRRIEKTVWNKGVLLSRSRFVYRGALLLAEFDAMEKDLTPILKTMWHWDPLQPVATRPLASISIKENDGRKESLYMLHDRMKNITALTDSSGNPCAAYHYAAFGGIQTMNGQAAQHNPFRFSSEYTDDELGLIAYTHRFYNPLEGRWLSRDPAGEQSSPNLYCFVGNRPNAAVDFQGLFLYAIDGTSYNGEATDVNDKKEGNVWRIYNLSTYEKNIGKKYFPGPDLISSIERRRNAVRGYICSNYCYKGKQEINLLGWSRGAAIAIDIADFLQNCGCPCTQDQRTRNISIAGLYLFDPVKMALPGILRTNYIYDNVKSYVIIYAASLNVVFNQVKPSDYSTKTEVKSFKLDYNSTHNDVGGDGEDSKSLNDMSRAFMIDKMKANGLSFEVDDYQGTGFTGYNAYHASVTNIIIPI